MQGWHDRIPGGACDGYKYQDIGYVMRGGREMDNHFECMWDLFRSIPSIEDENVTVLDEYYWLNKHDPNYSLCRATVNCGEDAHTDGKFGLSDKETYTMFLQDFQIQWGEGDSDYGTCLNAVDDTMMPYAYELTPGQERSDWLMAEIPDGSTSCTIAYQEYKTDGSKGDAYFVEAAL